MFQEILESLPGLFAGVESISTVEDGPVLPGQSDVAHHLLVVNLAVHRTAEGLLVKRISDTKLTGFGDQLFQEGLRHLSLNEDLKQGGAEVG